MKSADSPNSPPRPPARPLKRIAAVARLLFTPLALGFIVWAGVKNRDVLAGALNSARWDLLTAAALIWTANQVFAPFFARLILNGGNFRVSIYRAYRIHADNLPARYIPGGVWHSVGRAAAYHDLSAPARRIILFLYLENTLAPATALILGGAATALFRGLHGWGAAAAAGFGVGVLSIAAIPILGKRLILAGEAFPPKIYAASAALFFLYWAGAAAAFVTFVSAFPGAFALKAPMETAGAYLFAWAAGNVVIVAPQGLGVFETVATGLLSGAVPAGGAVALLATFRAVVLCSDLLSFFLARLIGMVRRKRP